MDRTLASGIAAMETLDQFDVTVSLASVAIPGAHSVVARFESVLNANHYAKWLSAENPDRVVTTQAFIDDREPNYVRQFLNGKRA